MLCFQWWANLVFLLLFDWRNNKVPTLYKSTRPTHRLRSTETLLRQNKVSILKRSHKIIQFVSVTFLRLPFLPSSCTKYYFAANGMRVTKIHCMFTKKYLSNFFFRLNFSNNERDEQKEAAWKTNVSKTKKKKTKSEEKRLSSMIMHQYKAFPENDS